MIDDIEISEINRVTIALKGGKKGVTLKRRADKKEFKGRNLFEYRTDESVQFYELAAVEGWLVPEDVTDEISTFLECSLIEGQQQAGRQQTQRRQQVAISNATEPEDWAENHSPTDSVMVRFRQEVDPRTGNAKTVEIAQGRRRLWDVAIWEKMDEQQKEAAERIGAGHNLRCGEVAFQVMSFERFLKSNGSGLNASEFMAVLETTYRAWVTEALEAKLNVEAVNMVCALGQPCTAIDGNLRKRHGWAKENLFAGLDLYCYLVGWKTGSVSV